MLKSFQTIKKGSFTANGYDVDSKQCQCLQQFVENVMPFITIQFGENGKNRRLQQCTLEKTIRSSQVGHFLQEIFEKIMAFWH